MAIFYLNDMFNNLTGHYVLHINLPISGPKVVLNCSKKVISFEYENHLAVNICQYVCYLLNVSSNVILYFLTLEA